MRLKSQEYRNNEQIKSFMCIGIATYIWLTRYPAFHFLCGGVLTTGKNNLTKLLVDWWLAMQSTFSLMLFFVVAEKKGLVQFIVMTHPKHHQHPGCAE